jgi:signal transduction histidine kinase
LRWTPDNSKSVETDQAPVPASPTNGLRIVLADDNADMREYIHGLLVKRGYDVIAVDNGQAALASIRAVRPALVLSDVMMPQLDGFSLLHKLRSDPQTRAIPVILISARAGEEARTEGMESGADDYLTKPFGARELLARVNTHLELARMRRETEETLRRLAEEALMANRTKDRFLAALSHELRTPLTPVLMTAATLCEDERLPQDVRDQLGMMERNITLEARLIDDLLDLTAVSSGKLLLHAQPCEAHELIRLAMEIIEDAAQTKGVRMDCQFDARQSGLMADPARLQQVIWNLLRNAVKFTPASGYVTIHTSNTTGPEGQIWLRVEVTDTGIGIDPDGLKKIFQPFEQGRVTGDHRYGGLGLGLTIARAIVEMHGGRISAHSDGENRGATFVVELPVTRPAALDSLPVRSPGAITPVKDVQTGRGSAVHRILLVEDHAPTLQVLSNLLGRSGYEVITVSNISNALTAAATGQFDLVISDLGLPDGSGIQLMARLRDQFGLRGIALTGYGMEEDIAMAREAGFIAHLVKPVHIAELRKILASLG